MTNVLISEAGIVDVILTVRRQRVILASDLAMLFGVSTKHLNQAIKRNRQRLSARLLLQLTATEQREVVTICDHLSALKFAAARPLAFTEYGAIMAANVLNSQRAIDMSVRIVRAFVSLRNMLATHRDLARRINALEKRYDGQFTTVFDALRQLLREAPKKPIGFR